MSPKTIGRYGPARGGVRVYEDQKRQLVTVFWRAGGKRRKNSYPLTAAGRKEARTFAKSLADERARLRNPRSQMVRTRELGTLYRDNQHHFRERTLEISQGRWAKWELYVGLDFIAEQADGLTMAGFVSALRQIGHAVNQIAAHVNEVKRVYRWARSVNAIAHNDVGDYLFKIGKDESRNEPEEYREWEHEALLGALDPQSSRTWRAHALLQFIGAQGSRINATLNLRWSDIQGLYAKWRRATDKTGHDWQQPMRWSALAALQTAWHWRQQDGYLGDYIFYSARRIGHYGVQGAHYALCQAEKRAGVAHRNWRAFHGLRRMNTADILEEFGDLKLAMEFTGHRDLRSFQKYLKRRDDRLAAAVAQLDDRDRQPESGTQPAPEPVEVGVSDWDERATGRSRTDDREHSQAEKRRTAPAVVAESAPTNRSEDTSQSGKSDPKPAPKRHPTREGGR